MENNEINQNQNEENLNQVTEEKETPPVEISKQNENEEEHSSPEEPSEKALKLAELLREAEHRGYLKAMNERAEKLFNEPVAGERADCDKTTHRLDNSVPGFALLSCRRKSVWEN